jgi:hypothetical protein
MKIHLFQELLALNQEFDHVLRDLERLEKEPKQACRSWTCLSTVASRHLDYGLARNGVISSTARRAKSFSFRVATVRACTRTAAAIIASSRM